MRAISIDTVLRLLFLQSVVRILRLDKAGLVLGIPPVVSVTMS